MQAPLRGSLDRQIAKAVSGLRGAMIDMGTPPHEVEDFADRTEGHLHDIVNNMVDFRDDGEDDS